jgi:hypothetical protein
VSAGPRLGMRNRSDGYNRLPSLRSCREYDHRRTLFLALVVPVICLMTPQEVIADHKAQFMRRQRHRGLVVHERIKISMARVHARILEPLNVFRRKLADDERFARFGAQVLELGKFFRREKIAGDPVVAGYRSSIAVNLVLNLCEVSGKSGGRPATPEMSTF